MELLRTTLIFMQVLASTHGSNVVLCCFSNFVIQEPHSRTAGIAKIAGIESTCNFLESELLEPLEYQKIGIEIAETAGIVGTSGIGTQKAGIIHA